MCGSLHSEQYALFLREGYPAKKHVIIEKPLVPTTVEANELIALALTHSPPLIIATYQNRRWDSDFMTVKNLIGQGILGDIVEFESRYDRWRPALKGGTWKEEAGIGQGIVYDLGSHLVDQVLTLFGTPSRVFAQIYNSRKIGAPDFDDAFFSDFFYDSSDDRKLPLVVTVRGSPLSAVESQLRFTVKGTKGSFVKHGIDTQEDQLKLDPPMSTEDPAFGVEPESTRGVLTEVDPSEKMVARHIPSEVGRYLDFYDNVGQALQARDASKLYVKPEEARETIRMIEIMYESNRSGKVMHVQKT